MKIKTVCYGKLKEFKSVKEAKDFYLECMMCSEGSEQSRYVQIYTQLCNGLTYCSDEEYDYDNLRYIAAVMR